MRNISFKIFFHITRFSLSALLHPGVKKQSETCSFYLILRTFALVQKKTSDND